MVTVKDDDGADRQRHDDGHGKQRDAECRTYMRFRALTRTASPRSPAASPTLVAWMRTRSRSIGAIQITPRRRRLRLGRFRMRPEWPRSMLATHSARRPIARSSRSRRSTLSPDKLVSRCNTSIWTMASRPATTRSAIRARSVSASRMMIRKPAATRRWLPYTTSTPSVVAESRTGYQRERHLPR